MVVLRQLTLDELSHLPPIDVSESGTIVYKYVGGQLEATPETWQRPPWTADVWRGQLADWQNTLHMDLLLGAFDGERLAGTASLRYHLTHTTAQLTTLHVSRAYRRQGVARQLTQEVIRLARESGAQALYVSATPSESAVGFYLSQGFRPTDQPHPEMFELEPEDIHMIRPL